MYPASVVTDAGVDDTLAQIRRRQGAVLQSGPPAQRPFSIPAATSQAILGLVPVFYPGTMNPSLAEKVHLDEGEERSGIDMQLLASGTAKIRGSVVGFALSNTEAWVTALAQSASSYAVSSRSKDGVFELLNIPPGHYTLRARATEPAVPSEPRSRPRTLSAFAEVDVAAEVEGIGLTLGEAISITGRLAFDAGPGSGTPGSVEVALKRLPSQEAAPSFSTKTTRDGSFVLPGIEAGRYALAVGQLGPDGAGWFLQSVRVNGQERLGRPIEVSTPAGDSGMQIVLAFWRRHTELVGVLRGIPAGAAARYYIVAFPVDASLWDPALGGLAMTAAIPTAVSPSRTCPAVRYLIAVISDPLLEWRTIDTLSALSKGAVMVRVSAGQRTIQDLQINR